MLNIDWPRIRRAYETSTDRSLSLRKLAIQEGISKSAIQQRAARYKWRKRVILAQDAVALVAARADQDAATRAAEALAPWIERQKEKFTRRGFKVAQRGLSRVAAIQRKRPANDPRDEANVSKAAETYHRIGRVALGMTDGQSPQAPLSIALLGSHNAVQIVQPSPNESDTDSQD